MSPAPRVTAPTRHLPSRVASPRASSSSRHRRPRGVAVRALDDPAPVETWQLWFGFFAGVSPFAIAAWEFGKRVAIQRACASCGGCGLVLVGARKTKCPACGGFLPWESWARFLSSDVGNGGVVRAPMGQRSVLYDVEASTRASREVADARASRDASARADAARAEDVDVDVDDDDDRAL